MKIRSLSHVGITVSNFEDAVDFYSRTFGFLRAPKGGVVEIFEFFPSVPSQHPVWNKPGPTHFTLDVKNVKQWYNVLKAKGITFLCEPQNTDGTEWVFMKDPDGNLYPFK
ncbi:VOC family protein [Vallitalea sp.]|jgi:catechol 2,3-dioxygenase-like lactoylglutathione lyase family enzyme|uniref:VOC family protein n=1 Tax=Vallitalea sp. TaxID=1882829 RepID=UPI002600F423|nr:VOC family protein [Vallitalea sp.]MCT4687235.1 VOC family protein [Vallitalea sp.]